MGMMSKEEIHKESLRLLNLKQSRRLSLDTFTVRTELLQKFPNTYKGILLAKKYLKARIIKKMPGEKNLCS